MNADQESICEEGSLKLQAQSAMNFPRHVADVANVADVLQLCAIKSMAHIIGSAVHPSSRSSS